jgi:hypothetical protein
MSKRTLIFALLLALLLTPTAALHAQGDDDPTRTPAPDDPSPVDDENADGNTDTDADTLTLTATDTLTDLTLSFDYPVTWQAAFVSGGGGFLFANSADAFDAAESSLLIGENDPLPDGGQALVALPFPIDAFGDAETLDERFEQVRGIFGGDEGLGETEDLLVGDFAARRAAIIDDLPNDGWVYLIDTDELGPLLLAVIYEPGAADDIAASVENIVATVRPGERAAAINPAAALPNTLDTTDGTFTIGYPDGWVTDPDTGTLASSRDALAAALEGEEIPDGDLTLVVLTPGDLEQFFGIAATLSPRDALSGLYDLLEIDEPVLDFPVLQSPAVIANAPDGLLPGQGAYIAMDSATGTIIYGVQYTGSFTDAEPTLIPILNSGAYTPLEDVE